MECHNMSYLARKIHTTDLRGVNVPHCLTSLILTVHDLWVCRSMLSSQVLDRVLTNFEDPIKTF